MNNIHHTYPKATANAIDCLKVCLKRLEKGIIELQNGNIDSFMDIQRQQNIAFANFKALDYLASTQGQDLNLIEEAKELVSQVMKLQNKSNTILANTLSKHKLQLEKISKGKQGICNYKQSAKIIKFLTKT
ncbi:MAG: hypothetical protein R3B45_12360 [Bdellovibrionota bacterium]